MLTVKGLSGGEKALMSSFAMSAAAFGRTQEVTIDHGQGASKIHVNFERVLCLLGSRESEGATEGRLMPNL